MRPLASVREARPAARHPRHRDRIAERASGKRAAHIEMSDSEPIQPNPGEPAPGAPGGEGVAGSPPAPEGDPPPGASESASADSPAPTPLTGPTLPVASPSGGLARSWPKFARGRRAAWLGVAVLCVAGGAVGSLLGARALAREDNAKKGLGFHLRSAEVASQLRVVIQREQDLAGAASTFFAVNPQASRSELLAWADQARLLHRFPELQRLSLVALIRAKELPAYETRVTGRTVTVTAPLAHGALTSAALTSAQRTRTPLPIPTSVPGFHISPSGQRPFYCFALAGVARGAGPPSPSLDYCKVTPALAASRDTAQSRYSVVHAGRGEGLAVDIPVYKRGTAPSGHTDRRRAFVGWVRELMSPQVALTQALRPYPAGAVRLRHGAGSAGVAFAAGAPQQGAQSAPADLGYGWSARMFAPAANAAVLSDSGALAVLVGGCALSVLLGLLVFALGAARSRPSAPARRQVPHQDLYDPLTGLPNRALTLDRAERIVARAGRQSGLVAGALLIDIDWFKDVNEKLGEAAGDQLLIAVGERLTAVVRTQDTVGRLGADEFVVLLEAAARGVRLDSLARRIIEAMHSPVQLEDFGPKFHMTASIGVAFGQYASQDDLLRDARMALYAAKVAGKDRYTLFNANMRSVIEGRGLLEVDLNKALVEKQLFPLYQPIYDLGTRRVTGVEALLRWQHPSRGVLLPADFLQVAEDTGLIVPIGRWLLEEVSSRAAAWNVAGHRVTAFVKISANQLDREGIVTDVRRALQQSGLDPSLLTLEVAEEAVMRDVAAATRRLREIKGLGVRVAIDEFGSGYAFRSHLQQLPLDFLKVDRGTLAESDAEDYRHWLLEAILVFGRDLALPVIAKGVETAEQLSELRASGCAMAQGSYLGEPLPAASVQEALAVPLPQEAQPTSGAPQPGTLA
jgi:diguanylate cyclase (GGDEF)-like protein